MKQDIGTLLHLYVDEIETDMPTEVHSFLIMGAANAINEADGRNWIPLIVKQIGEDSYKVVANAFILAAAEEASLKKVWCIIADDSEVVGNSARILAQESISKINLAQASRDDIKVALDYLINRPVNPLKGVKLATATERIDAAPRQYWKESLTDVLKLKCGITKGNKLNVFKEVFYTVPSAQPEPIKKPKQSTNSTSDSTDKPLNKMTVAELKKMAKKRGFSGYSKFKKGELVKLLSEE